ncbi:DUF305 domain-containing protein [Glycomyces artemisiae]|uniref:Uncharacterized protein (DUF305 family) n=1 Tax=Glycomyces artemisiae TaxID=1076443 RepID=A0A2T0USU3_9ACTN|nr:DUF305 domain-containing protein [Glycomyces artemisiae]PRY60918.1 uncharacterized protein (DUF305 family) [Glycomyces artemisiae]
MSKTFTLRRALSAGLAVFAALSIAACSDSGDDGGHDMNSMESESESATDADFNDADVSFLQMMIPHHEQAVAMSDLAAAQAEDPEVVDLAAQIAAAQQPEIDEMTGLLDEWGQSAEMEGHDGMSMSGMATDAQMTELEAAHGADFDRLFVDLMIAHHQGAVDMAEEEQTEGQNAEAIALADAIITAQTAEIETLEAIRTRLG